MTTTAADLLSLGTDFGRDRQMLLLREQWRETHEALLAIAPQTVMRPELHDSWQDRIQGRQPAAGASFTYTVPGDFRIEPLAVTFRLTTSATAGDRAPVIEWQESDGTAYCVAGTNVDVSNNDAKRFCGHSSAGVGVWPVGDVAVFGMPSLLMFPTDKLVVRVANIDSADQLDLIRVSARFYSTRDHDAASDE